MQAQIAECDRDLGALSEIRVAGLHGESFTAEEAADIAQDLQAKIRADVDRGYRKHDPVGRGERLLASLAPFADFLVFLYFLAVIFNVNWLDPRTTLIEAMLALVLSIIATVGVAWALRWFGRHFRGDKADDGRFRWRRRSGRGTPPELILLVAILTGVALMMCFRVFTDAAAAQAGTVVSALVALFMAVITLALNYVIFMVAYSDGSPTTDELQHLTKELEPVESRRSATTRRRQELLQRLEMLQAESNDDERQSRGPSSAAISVAEDAAFVHQRGVVTTAEALNGRPERSHVKLSE